MSMSKSKTIKRMREIETSVANASGALFGVGTLIMDSIPSDRSDEAMNLMSTHSMIVFIESALADATEKLQRLTMEIEED